MAKIEIMGKEERGGRRRREGKRRKETSKGGEDVDEIRINQQRRLRYQLRGNQTKVNMEKRDIIAATLIFVLSGRREARRPSIIVDKSVLRGGDHSSQGDGR